MADLVRPTPQPIDYLGLKTDSGDLMSDQQGTNETTAVRAQRPWTIRWAVLGMWVGAAMTVLGVYVFYLEVDATNRKTFGPDYAATDGLVQTGLTISMGIAVVLAVIEVGLWITMALTNHHGLGWARIVATVLAAIGLVYAIFVVVTSGLSDTLIIPSLGYNIVNEVLAVAIVVTLWRPKSGLYFRARTVERARRAMMTKVEV